MILRFNNFKQEYHKLFLLYGNYFLILYAFLLPISTDYSRIVFNIILILFLLLFDIKKRILFILKNSLVQALLLFYLIHFAWMLGSEHLDIAFFKVKEFRYILYILIFSAIIKNDFKEKILNGFIFGILFSELMSYSILFNIHIPFIQLNSQFSNVPFMASYTQYSVVLSISLGLILYKLLNVKELYKKNFYLFFLISASINIFIIESKLGYGLFFMAIITTIIFLLKKEFNYKKVMFIISFITFGYFIAYNTSPIFQKTSSNFITDIKNSINKQDYGNSTGERIYFYLKSFTILKENSLFGLGTGDHIEIIKNLTLKDNNISQYRKVTILKNISSGNNASLHSEYLDNSMQFGILGLIIFLNIFYQMFKQTPKNNIIVLLGIIVIVIYLINATVSLIFIHSTLGKLFILFSALLIPSYNKIKS